MRPVSPRKNEKSSHRFGREARLYNGMTQTSSANIAAIKPSMEYAAPCMSMRWATSAIRHERSSLLRPRMPATGRAALLAAPQLMRAEAPAVIGEWLA
jgi:hypothetical protein